MNRFPPDFFQTRVFGEPEALLSDGKYNPPLVVSDRSMSSVTCMASQVSSDLKKIYMIIISIHQMADKSVYLKQAAQTTQFEAIWLQLIGQEV